MGRAKMRTEQLRIPADHPVFADHFPGRPLLPGSVLLDFILANWGDPVARVSSVKFLRPLAPHDVVTLTFTPAPGDLGIRFGCMRGTDMVCCGTLIPERAPH
jgi:3-hydroxymyristoyl/3-hydroxydecanoyl-(acyl carrier protein) dehydratase